MYRVREIDAEEYHDDLTSLHRLTFFKKAPIPNFRVGHWWIVWQEGEAVGFAGMIPSDRFPATGYFTRVGILPAHTGHGLQRRLMLAIERRARKNGWNRLVSDCTDNIYSANNFIRSGWLLIDPEPKWSFHNSLYWSKDLP